MSEFEITIKIIIACVLGGLIGLSREREKKAAGLRTHILVCMGSALFTMISFFIVQSASISDPSRIISNILVGIGFIGAGTIIHESNGIIIGITTAASIWMTAAIGTAIGCGFYYAAIISTLVTLLVLYFLHTIEKKYIRNQNE